MQNQEGIHEYLALMAEWQELIAEALSNAPTSIMWTPWFNMFRGDRQLVQDADPIASLVNCRVGRGVSVHLYPASEIQGRWARLRCAMEGFDDEIDHLQIALPRENPPKEEVRQLIAEWIGLNKSDDVGREKLIEQFCVNTEEPSEE